MIGLKISMNTGMNLRFFRDKLRISICVTAMGIYACDSAHPRIARSNPELANMWFYEAATYQSLKLLAKSGIAGLTTNGLRETLHEFDHENPELLFAQKLSTRAPITFSFSTSLPRVAVIVEQTSKDGKVWSIGIRDNSAFSFRTETVLPKELSSQEWKLLRISTLEPEVSD
jgi:hypothetical protein